MRERPVFAQSRRPLCALLANPRLGCSPSLKVGLSVGPSRRNTINTSRPLVALRAAIERICAFARLDLGELSDDLEAFSLGEAGYHGTDWHPPDVKVRVAGAPGTRTRIETPALLGRKPALVPDQSLMDGINAGRKTIPFARFDKKRTAQGLEGLCHVRAFYLSTPLRHSRTA